MPLTPPKKHHFIQTQDGSTTLFSEFYQEACHSTYGAKEETLKFYIQNGQLIKKAQEFWPLNILEIGLGLGLAFELSLQQLILQNINFKLHYVALEKDLELINWAQLNSSSLNQLSWIQVSGQKTTLLRGTSSQFVIDIIHGNARDAVLEFSHYFPDIIFHLIYQDPFSPPKNPTLWTVEWFDQLKKWSHQNATLTTYSSSSCVRKALNETGWAIFEGGGFAKKRSSTIARLQGQTSPEILRQLERSPVNSLHD